ncbi:MAG: PD-(D/E)XK nuclease family protein [Syntrophales bacterium]|nr:PD-(D/E)XK nuclease family protein [Syntrophales bacterium]
MDLLSELQGLSGENLCSATLRLLLIRSQDLRERLINLISRENRMGPIMIGSHFSCTLEEPTEDSGRWGRLDLFLEMSDAVVGIENKLYASFQEGQPHKYLNTVSQRAKALATIRGKHYQGLVAVLAPNSRYTEIEAVIGKDEGLLALTWEEILDDFSHSAESLDSETKVLLHALDSYIRQQISLFPEWARWTPHLRRSFDRGGTPLQRTVVGKVWQFFPDAGGRLSSGATWCGYYFTDRSLGAKGWYGFVPKEEVVHGAKNEVEFIVAVSFDVQFPENVFREIQLKAGPGFIGASEIHSWAIELDDSWSQPDSWRHHLQPLSDAYERIRNAPIEKSG